MRSLTRLACAQECLLLEADEQLQCITDCANKAQGGSAMKQRLQASKRAAELREQASEQREKLTLHEKVLSRLLVLEKLRYGTKDGFGSLA